jgi:oligopeptide transport system ATP-binding protein
MKKLPEMSPETAPKEVLPCPTFVAMVTVKLRRKRPWHEPYPWGGTMPDGGSPVLDVQNLKTVFRTRGGTIHAVNSVSFHLRPGELLGVVGESGSGKSVTMMSLLGLLPSPPAEVRADGVLLEGRNILTLGPEGLRGVRGREVGFVFQDPMTSLNPVFNVGFQIMEPLRTHLKMSRAQARDRAIDLLNLVGIPDAARRLSDYPHQFSGGMRQRVMIAIALACDPKVLIADEPTTALDVTIQAQILELVKDLRKKLGMAIIWITHDLGVIAGIADRVMVMYGGQVVEQGPVRTLFADPAHPYTRALLQTVPKLHGPRDAKLRVIQGQPPLMTAAPTACPFRDRCTHAHDRCARENPVRRPLGAGHDVACHWDHRTAAAPSASPVAGDVA